MTRAAFVIAVFVLGGCTTTYNTDGAPGENVVVRNTVASELIARDFGSSTYPRIRVIAPHGAEECRSEFIWTTPGPGPQKSGQPNADREVMLTSDERRARFACTTEDRVVRRSVRAGEFAVAGGAREYARFYMPPMVHMDPDDPGAEARWGALHTELCGDLLLTREGMMCHPPTWETLKRIDLGD